jgi:hypothetical protein
MSMLSRHWAVFLEENRKYRKKYEMGKYFIKSD